MTDLIQVACLQQSFTADKHANLEKTFKGIQAAATQGAQLVVLPELHASLYFCQTESIETFELAEALDGPTAKMLEKAAKEFSVVVVGSIFERRAVGLCHNTALVFDRDGSRAGIYRKMHIPDDPGYYEKYYFTPGDLGFQPIQTSLGKLGVLVCWDQWFPEAARLMALAGADCLIYPTAIGWNPDDNTEEQAAQRDAWITVQRGHAVANHLPVISCNRVGFEKNPSSENPGQQFWGSSFITDQQGQIKAQASVDTESVLLSTIDKSRTRFIRQQWPFLRDRRIDAYQNLTQYYADKLGS